MSSYKINGQDLRTAGYRDPVLTRAALAANTLTFTQILGSPADVAGTLEKGDAVTLTDPADNVIFRGLVTERQVTFDESGTVANFTVSGAWWTLEKTTLTGTLTDDEGNDSERAQFTLAEATLGDSLRALISRFQTLGISIVEGVIDDAFTLPRLTLSNTSCAAALIDLARWCPDGILYLDDAPEVPTINFTRRGSAAAQSYTYGQPPLAAFNLADTADLRPPAVVLNYLTRATDGRAQFANQISTGDTLADAQHVTISGPENADFLPSDTFDSQDVQTEPIGQWGSVANAQVALKTIKRFNSQLSGITDFSGFGWIFFLSVRNTPPGSSFGQTTSFSGQRPIYTLEDGTTFQGLSGEPTPYPYVTTDGAAPNFDASSEFVPATLAGTFGVIIREQNGTWPDFPAWTQGLGGADELIGWPADIGWDPNVRIWAKIWRMSAPTWLSDTEFPTLTTLYKPADYAFLAPPPGLADNLKSSQTFDQIRGQLTLRTEPALPPLAPVTIPNVIDRALPSSIDTNIARDEHTINFGPPDALTYLDLVNHFRQSGQDNIIPLDNTEQL